MPVLANSKHEQFAMAIAKGVGLAEAYISAGYSECGAKQSAARLLRNANIRARVAQIQSELSASTIALEISNRNARVQALQERWDKLHAGLKLILEERARDLAHFPGGASGLLALDYRGKREREVLRIDSGIVSLFSELRAHEQQAAQELSQWQTKAVVEERKVIDATPAAIALASMLSLEQLEELERKLAEPAQLPAPVVEVSARVG